MRSKGEKQMKVIGTDDRSSADGEFLAIVDQGADLNGKDGDFILLKHKVKCESCKKLTEQAEYTECKEFKVKAKLIRQEGWDLFPIELKYDEKRS